MTERSESERAELVALADWIEKSDYLVTPGIRACKQIVAALRSLAAQDQKPVAWRILCTDKSRGSTGYYYTEQLPFEPGENLRQRSEPVPLYLEPPPAAGWDQAIEACKKVAEKWLESFMGGEAYVARSIVNAIEALRHNAPPDSGAGKSEQPAVLTYTNYRGETSVRSIIPRSVRYGSTEWHPEPQWLLLAHDTEKNADREFALKDFGVPDHGGADAGVGVKPLEWHQHPDGETKRYEGVAVIGNNYTVVQAWWGAQNKWGWIGNGEFYHSDVEARRACNTDYEQRILAALSKPAPVAANASAELQNDLGEMLRALGMSDAAQPRSPHKVFQSAIAEMKRQIADASAEARLRDAFFTWIDKRIQNTILNQRTAYASGNDALGSRYHAAQCELWTVRGEFEALSTTPHASDCDKQGER